MTTPTRVVVYMVIYHTMALSSVTYIPITPTPGVSRHARPCLRCGCMTGHAKIFQTLLPHIAVLVDIGEAGGNGLARTCDGEHAFGTVLGDGSAPKTSTIVTERMMAVTGSASLSRKIGRASIAAAFHTTSVQSRKWWFFSSCRHQDAREVQSMCNITSIPTTGTCPGLHGAQFEAHEGVAAGQGARVGPHRSDGGSVFLLPRRPSTLQNLHHKKPRRLRNVLGRWHDTWAI